jgi:uncharacterized delta-60 repeat protein
MLAHCAASRAAVPTITYQPKSQRVLLYEQAAFGVIADGTSPLAYQWFKNGAPLAGATNDQIVIGRTQLSDEGRYSVAITNVDGTISSTNAELVVRLPRGGDLDGSFLTGGSIDRTVRAIAVQPNGKILIAGDFTRVNGLSRAGIARLNPDGTTDYTFLAGLLGVNGTVYSAAVQPDERIVIGGMFTDVNGVGRTNIARLKADGSLDTAFQNGLSGIGASWNSTAVHSVALQSDGKILVAGSFSTVNGIVCSNLARLDIQGNLDTNFQAVTLAPEPYYTREGAGYFVPTIQAMVVAKDDSVVVAGIFLGNVLQLNADGTVRTRYDLTALFDEGAPEAVCLDTNGDIIVGGEHDGFRENPYPVVARLTTNGGYNSFAGLSSIVGGISSVATRKDGTLLAGGILDGIVLVRFNPDGTGAEYLREQSLGITVGDVDSIAVQADGRVLAGGQIVGSGTGILRLSTDNTLDSSFGNGISTTDGTVGAAVVQPDDKLVIAGSFRTVHGLTRNHVARLSPDGALDTSFQDPSVNGDYVYSTALQADGKVLIGGDFTNVSGATHTGVARLNPDGAVDSGFSAQVLFTYSNPGPVYSMAVQPDGKIVIGGAFLSVNGTAHTNIARLNSDGSLDNGFQAQASGFTVNVAVYQLALQADGKVLIAGGFNQVNGQPRQYLARLNPDGTLDDSLSPQTGIPAVVVQPDGKILLGTSRLNQDGSIDSNFQPAVISTSIVLQSDGRIVAGGATNIVRLNPDGSLDSSFQCDQSGIPLALQANGKILIGGDLRRLWGSDFPPVLKMPNPTAFGEELSWHAISNRTYRLQYTDALGANTWSNLSGDILATNDLASRNILGWGARREQFYRVQALP